MSMLLMVQAMKVKVGSAARKLVLIKLADNANDNGKCWPSYDHIANHCEMDKRTVMRHIKALSEAGFVMITRRKKEDGDNMSNMYTLYLNPSDKMTPPNKGVKNPSDNLTLGSDRMSPPSDPVSRP